MHYKTLCESVRSECDCRQYPDTSASSSRYRKRKATDAEETLKDLDRTRMNLRTVTSEKDRLLLENANMQRRLTEARHLNELLKPRVGRTTALGILVQELCIERQGDNDMRRECASLKTAVAIHEQRAAALEDALLQRNDVVLEVHTTRTQQCDQNEILMGSIEIVNEWPVNRQGRISFEFRGEERIEVQVKKSKRPIMGLSSTLV